MPSIDTKVQFEIRGWNRVRNQLRTVAKYHPNVSDRVVERHTKRVAGQLRRKPYPPKRPQQKYQRTGDLGKSFRAQKERDAHWRIINRVKSRKYQRPYAIHVIKKGRQPWFHKNRWWTIDEEVEKTMPELTRTLTQELEREMERG